MKRLASAMLVLAATCAVAKEKPHYTYQDAVLVSFRTVTTGSSCSHTANTTGDVNANADDDGNTTGTVKADTEGSSTCRNNSIRRYTLKVSDRAYVIEPAYAFLNRPSSLAYQLPGAHVLIRIDSKGFYVKVGKKESRFDVVTAQ